MSQELYLGLLCPVVPKSLQSDIMLYLKFEEKGAYLHEGAAVAYSQQQTMHHRWAGVAVKRNVTFANE